MHCPHNSNDFYFCLTEVEKCRFGPLFVHYQFGPFAVMRLRFLVFSIGLSRISAQYNIPTDVFAQNVIDCEDINAEPGNRDFCIQCYDCTYQYMSDNPGQGGQNCIEGPWDEMDTPYMFKEYCYGFKL